MKLGMGCGAAGSVFVRRVLLGAVASACLFGANSAAQASAGCTALEGTFSGGAASGSTSGTTFDAGDTITLTVTAVGGGDRLGLYNNTTHTPLVLSFDTVGTQTYVVPAATSDELIISGTRANAGSSFSWSCAAGGGSTLGDVQEQGTSVVANTSATNISGSVNSEIDDALNDSTSESTIVSREEYIMSREEYEAYIHEFASRAAANSIYWSYEMSYSINYSFNMSMYDRAIADGEVPVRTASGIIWVPASSVVSQFVAERRSDVSRRVEQAFAPLGYGPIDRVDPLAAPVFPSRWSTWADVRGSGFRQSSPSGLNGTQINFTAGLSYKLKPNVVVGLFGGYENFSYEFTSVTDRLKGDGGTIGAYAGWQIAPTLRWKGILGWSGLGYDAATGGADGRFGGSRLLLSTGLTGRYDFGGYIIEPSADIFAIWERQSAYTDSLGAQRDARSFSSGRIALGGKASAPQWVAGITPHFGIYGDWRFASNNASSDWSARVTSGVNVQVFKDGSLSLGAEYGGIGAGYKSLAGNARLTLPF